MPEAEDSSNKDGWISKVNALKIEMSKIEKKLNQSEKRRVESEKKREESEKKREEGENGVKELLKLIYGKLDSQKGSEKKSKGLFDFKGGRWRSRG